MFPGPRTRLRSCRILSLSRLDVNADAHLHETARKNGRRKALWGFIFRCYIIGIMGHSVNGLVSSVCRAHVPGAEAEHAKQEQQHARQAISVPLFHHLAFLRVQRYDLFVVFCTDTGEKYCGHTLFPSLRGEKLGMRY